MTIDLDAFTQGYIDCALWSSSIEEDFASYWHEKVQPALDPPAPDVSMESFGFTVDDIDLDALERIRENCNDFVKANLDDLNAYASERSWTSAGHDFWLTRNGHGAGFWDRGLGELGDRLAAEAKTHGEQVLYIGDDERIYVT